MAAGAVDIVPNRRRLRPMNLTVDVLPPRKRLRGKQQKPANYPEMPSASPFYCPMHGCGLGMAIVFDNLAKAFVVNMPSTIDRRVPLDHNKETYVTLSLMRRCCKAMGALVAPALAHSGIYGVCYLRFKYDMHRYGLNWSGHWPQAEWLAAHRADPALARQLAIAWNTDGKTRPPSQLEAWRNRYSLPRGLVRLEFPHDLYPFTTQVSSDSDGTNDENEESSESET